MTGAIPILLYHSISQEPRRWISQFTVSPSAFADQLDAIVESERTLLTVSGLVDRLVAGSLPERPAVVTFDDGFADTGTVAAPLLLERGIAFTVYITTAYMQCGLGPGAERMLSPQDVRQLAETGVEIGAHSRTHPALDTLPLAGAAAEVHESKALLEAALAAPVRSFAYPHGHSSRAVRAAVRSAGFDSACAVGNALSHERDDVFALARLTVEATTSTAEIKAWLHGEGARLAPAREGFRTRAGRAYRRLGTRAGLFRPVSADMESLQSPLQHDPRALPEGEGIGARKELG